MPLVTRVVDAIVAFVHTVDPKVKLPVVVGTTAAAILALLPLIGADVPTLAPEIAIATTILTAIVGYRVPSK